MPWGKVSRKIRITNPGQKIKNQIFLIFLLMQSVDPCQIVALALLYQEITLRFVLKGLLKTWDLLWKNLENSITSSSCRPNSKSIHLWKTPVAE